MYKRILRAAIKEARESIIHELIRAGRIPKPHGVIDYPALIAEYRDEVDDILRRVVDELLLAD
ncbi:MAG: hypothetical protein ACM3RP_02245 [Chitinophagales bacterium]